MSGSLPVGLFLLAAGVNSIDKIATSMAAGVGSVWMTLLADCFPLRPVA